MPGPQSRSATAEPSGKHTASASNLDAAFQAASARLAKASSREALGQGEARPGGGTAASNSKPAAKTPHMPHLPHLPHPQLPHLPQPHMPHLPKPHLPTSLTEMMRSTKPQAQDQKPVLESQQAAVAQSNRQDVKCPAGHKLEEFVADGRGFSCDECRKSITSGQKLSGCRRCDYDLCSECHAKAKALMKPSRPVSPPSSGGPGALFTSVLFSGAPAKDKITSEDDDANFKLHPRPEDQQASLQFDSAPASARSSGSDHRAISGAPSKDLRVAGTHMVDMVLPWLKPAPPPPYREVEEEHLRREQRMRTEAREREMDRHVEECLKSHRSRSSLQHNLSSRAFEHNTWQNQVEDAARAVGWAFMQVVGGCTASPPTSQAPGSSGPCCSSRSRGEDYGDFNTMPGVERVIDSG